jgi:DnaK suppressor protein
LREILTTERETLCSTLHDELMEQIGGDRSSQFATALDAADLSVVDLMESLRVRIVDIKQERLTQMVEAERKLDEGTYGLCEMCGAEIGEQRLAALPFAIYCIRCAELQEGDDVSGRGPTL